MEPADTDGVDDDVGTTDKAQLETTDVGERAKADDDGDEPADDKTTGKGPARAKGPAPGPLRKAKVESRAIPLHARLTGRVAVGRGAGGSRGRRGAGRGPGRRVR